MPYDYKNERPKLFTEENHEVISNTRDNIRRATKDSGGVCTLEVAVHGVASHSWIGLAAVDYLEEKGMIRVSRPTGAAAQNYIIRNLGV